MMHKILRNIAIYIVGATTSALMAGDHSLLCKSGCKSGCNGPLLAVGVDNSGPRDLANGCARCNPGYEFSLWQNYCETRTRLVYTPYVRQEHHSDCLDGNCHAGCPLKALKAFSDRSLLLGKCSAKGCSELGCSSLGCAGNGLSHAPNADDTFNVMRQNELPANSIPSSAGTVIKNSPTEAFRAPHAAEPTLPPSNDLPTQEPKDAPPPSPKPIFEDQEPAPQSSRFQHQPVDMAKKSKSVTRTGMKRFPSLLRDRFLND